MAEILIVEDAALQQRIIRGFVEPEHTVIGTVSDGEEAVEFVEEHETDVVIMDIDLRDVDGITAAERIKSHDPETEIIMSTALVSEEIKTAASRIPIEAYLIKPYSGEELLDSIEGALQ
jgi:two-component system chemotaxis response regulator CheY